MADNSNAIAQVRQFWATRNGRQKAFLAGGAIATGLLVAVFVRLIGAPDYKPLSSGLDGSDSQALAARLDQQGIAHQTSADGKTISVPETSWPQRACRWRLTRTCTAGAWDSSSSTRAHGVRQNSMRR